MLKPTVPLKPGTGALALAASTTWTCTAAPAGLTAWLVIDWALTVVAGWFTKARAQLLATWVVCVTGFGVNVVYPAFAVVCQFADVTWQPFGTVAVNASDCTPPFLAMLRPLNLPSAGDTSV